VTGRGRDIARAAHRPRLRARVVVLSGVWIAALAFVLLGIAETLPSGLGNAALIGVTVPLVVSTITVGAVLATRLPRHIIGWLLLAGGFSLAVSIGAGAIADYGLNEHPGSVPGASWFAILAGATGGSFIGFLGGFVPLFFPTGRLPSPRWRAVVLIAFAERLRDEVDLEHLRAEILATVAQTVEPVSISLWLHE
jgi:hypothetical protein